MRRSLLWCFVILGWWVWFAVILGMEPMMATPASLLCAACMKILFGWHMEDVAVYRGAPHPEDGAHVTGFDKHALEQVEEAASSHLPVDAQTENHPSG